MASKQAVDKVLRRLKAIYRFESVETGTVDIWYDALTSLTDAELARALDRCISTYSGTFIRPAHLLEALAQQGSAGKAPSLNSEFQERWIYFRRIVDAPPFGRQAIQYAWHPDIAGMGARPTAEELTRWEQEVREFENARKLKATLPGSVFADPVQAALQRIREIK